MLKINSFYVTRAAKKTRWIYLDIAASQDFPSLAARLGGFRQSTTTEK